MIQPDSKSDWLKPPSLLIERGRRIRLSLPRRQMGDLMHFAMKVPSIPVQRHMRLGPLLAARRGIAGPRPKWVALVAKGFSQVALEFPQLRQSYIPFPRAHLYEHPSSVAAIAIERDYHGEKGVFFARLHAPDRQPISTLDAHLRYFTEAPFEQLDEFSFGLFISRLWRPVRRSLWWTALNVSGSLRSFYFGTFGISVYSNLGAESLHPISPNTCLLNFGEITNDGNVDLRLIYDHRVLDGSCVARALKRLEEVLNDQITGELDSIPERLLLSTAERIATRST